ncbi:hypothetical protein Poli38472_010315 [Pythium oligandrum]|uniref:WD repeat-containing protein 4 homolog n=1 Tax=Pythium oligandrum TaxID=41045 RepID=A0A8K1C303_PYTOL|nr:hypothetical protein Poli38472_010315 [Pythium oligandrum]|eukprot:TMW55433.1 hypothetical protein Poli38472_010315 [Pythium oligandrum]
MTNGVVLTAARDALALIRHTTLLLLTLTDGQPSLRVTYDLLHELPQHEATASNDAAEGEDEPKEQTQSKQRVTATAFFQPEPEQKDVYALLALLDERKLVHYEANVATNTITVRAVREMQRNSTSMSVSSLRVNEETKHVVIVGEKTGEAVAMPFPHLNRDLRTLLGHTTSMITHMAVNHDRSLLLTADRDEKIRISHFPRTSLVQSYCLGHKASVTRIATSAVTPQLVVSTSLDNSIKLWNVEDGTLYDSQALLKGEDLNAALLNVSLAVCPVRNLALVVLNNSELRFFAIENVDGDAFKLVAKDLSPQVRGFVSAHEPSEAVFTPEGSLVLAYRRSPFVRLFDVSSVTASNVGLNERSAHDELTRLRKEAAAIELPKDEDDNADDLEGGLQKKKVKLNEWKSKLPSTN